MPGGITNSFSQIVFLFVGATLGHTVALYTFSNTGSNPYSFSFLEMNPLNTTGAFAIAPFQVDALTFTQATLTQADGTGCFQFGTAGASLTATQFSCGLSAFAPDGGWQSLFLGETAPGTYTAFNAASDGSAPTAPGQLTITDLPEPATRWPFAAGLVVLAAVFERVRRCPQVALSAASPQRAFIAMVQGARLDPQPVAIGLTEGQMLAVAEDDGEVAAE